MNSQGLLFLFRVATYVTLLAALFILPAFSNAQPSVERTPAPLPSGTFNPDDFAPITSSTLPLENGQRIVMRVNDTPITWEDYTARIRMMGAAVYEEHPGKEAHIAAALGHTIQDDLILNAIYREYAQRNRLMPEQREIQQEMKNFITDYSGKVVPAASLLTPQQIESSVTGMLIRQKVNRYIGDRATTSPATESELTSFTQTIRPFVQNIPILRARHIVLRATPDMTEFNRNDAKARAEEIRQRIDDGNNTAPPGARLLPFEVAVRQFSQDRLTTYLGGDLGYFRKGSMYPAINEALSKLQPGEISPVIQSRVGYHILQLTEQHDNDLRLQYDRYRSDMAVRDWQMEAMKRAKVENYLQ